MLSYWKAPAGPVERVYLQISPGRTIYGQRVVGDRVAWRGQDMEPAEAERTAQTHIGSLPSWTALREMVEVPGERPAVAPQTIGVSAAPTRAIVDQARHEQRRPEQRRPEQRRPQRRELISVDVPYTGRDTQKLDVYSLGAMSGPTRLVVDSREPREIANLLSRVENLKVEIAPLATGRYQVAGCLAIDRMSTQDLHRGILDDPRPVIARVCGLSELDHAALFLIEGGLRSHRRASLEKIDGALSYVTVVHRVPVIETIDVWETVYVIVRAIRHACHADDDQLPRPDHRRGGRKEHRISPRYVLEGIPGVSTIRATHMLERFGSLQGVAAASYQDLLDIPGLGPTVAQAVHDVFRST